jgi:hypothetical protein
MSWPARADYDDTVQNPRYGFADAALQSGAVRENSFGPLLASALRSGATASRGPIVGAAVDILGPFERGPGKDTGWQFSVVCVA